MKTIKYYTSKIRFFINLKTRPTNVTNGLELTNPRFGVDLNKAKAKTKELNSLLSQMYSEDINSLFI